MLAGGLGAVVLAAGPLALLVRAGWPPLITADQAVTRAAERAVHASGPLLAAARAATALGTPALTWLVTVAVAVGLLARGDQSQARSLAGYLLLARAGAQLLSTGLKTAVDRTRPVFEVPVDTAAGASFPSGHTVAAGATWTALAVLALPAVPARRRPLLLAVAVAVPVAVAASRVLLGVHYLSDVVGGLLLGAGWTAACTAVLLPGRFPGGGRRPLAAAAGGDRDDQT